MPTQICIDISNWFVAYWYVPDRNSRNVGDFYVGLLLLQDAAGSDEYRPAAVKNADLSETCSGKSRSPVSPRTCRCCSAPACRYWTAWRSPPRPRATKSSRRRSWRAASASARERPWPNRLRDSKIFPPLVCQMVAVGESTGGLDNMLKKVAELYEEEVDDAVNKSNRDDGAPDHGGFGSDSRRPGHRHVLADLPDGLSGLRQTHNVFRIRLRTPTFHFERRS
jgi:hypothetical protein